MRTSVDICRTGITNGTDPSGLLDPLEVFFIPSGPTRPGVKPKDAPHGTLAIDNHPLVEHVHEIKGNLEDEGVGPASWVGITPNGEIVVTNPDGTAEIIGPVKNYMHRIVRTPYVKSLPASGASYICTPLTLVPPSVPHTWGAWPAPSAPTVKLPVLPPSIKVPIRTPFVPVNPAPIRIPIRIPIIL